MISLATTHSEFDGFSNLISFQHQLSQQKNGDLEVDFSEVYFFEANLCSVLGAILREHISLYKQRVILSGMKPEVRRIFQTNGFLRNFGFSDKTVRMDTFQTTIEYQEFADSNSTDFSSYVEKHFVDRGGIPKMSKLLQKKFRESLWELFENAVEHSESRHGIFACGQYFPRKKRLDFSIVDLGMGMKMRIERSLNLQMTAEEAIKWTFEANHTTRARSAGKPGGLGLKLIKEFISHNNGRIQIVSDAGYWLYRNGRAESRKFRLPFPGTIVDVQINAADTQSYRLVSEIDPANIF